MRNIGSRVKGMTRVDRALNGFSIRAIHSFYGLLMSLKIILNSSKFPILPTLSCQMDIVMTSSTTSLRYRLHLFPSNPLLSFRIAL